MYGLKTEWHFDSAHFLADYHGKCENLHGHRWRVVCYLRTDALGEAGTERDMVMDFGALEEGTLAPATVAALEAEGFSLTVLPFRTTAENLARHICGELRDRGLPCAQVDVYETPLNCATYLAE